MLTAVLNVMDFTKAGLSEEVSLASKQMGTYLDLLIKRNFTILIFAFFCVCVCVVEIGDFFPSFKA